MIHNPRAPESEIQDNVQRAVERAADNICKSLQSSGDSLLFVHLLTGTPAVPYCQRRTATRVGAQAGLARYIPADAAPDKLQAIHATALDDYIKYLERDNTLLHRIARLAAAAREDATTARVYVADTNEPPKPDFLFDEQVSPKDRRRLVPAGCAERFFQFLYARAANRLAGRRRTDAAVGDVDFRQAFKFALAHCYGIQMEMKDQEEQDASLERALQRRAAIWERCAAVQSALLYYEAAGSSDGANNCTAFVERKERNGRSMLTLAVAIVGPGPVSKEEEARIRLSLESLAESAESLKEGDDGSEARIAGFDARALVANVFTVPYPHSLAAARHVEWCAAVAMKLTNAVHEGTPLDFFFVLGERSEFADHPSTSYRGFNDECNVHLLCNKGGEREKNALITANEMKHEHFPWFERGRHALFWDLGVVYPAPPSGLVAIPVSSWTTVASLRSDQRCTVSLPNCILCAVDGRRHTATFLAISNCQVKARTQLVDKTWLSAAMASKRANSLGDFLLASVGNRGREGVSDKVREEIREISAMAVDVADDPTKGGAIVVVKSIDDLKLASMGTPLGLAEALLEDDRIALIAHDGATLHVMERDEQQAWSHRRLLAPDERCFVALQKTFESWENDNSGSEWPLRNKGSRRWSAAAMAFHPDVIAVVAISQDGGIQCWSELNGNVSLSEIPLKDGPSRHWEGKISIPGPSPIAAEGPA